MVRTQITLTTEQKRRLDQRAAETGLSMSELVRRAVDEVYGRQQRSLEADLAAIDAAFGAWKDRDFDGEEYVERLRAVDRKPGW